MILYRCAQCRAVIRTGDENRGSKEKCPHCGAPNSVPDIEGRHGSKKRRGAEASAEDHADERSPVTVVGVLKVLVLAAAAAGVFATLLWYLHYRNRPEPAEAATLPLRPHLREYLDVGPLENAPADHPHAPYVVGKVVMINRVEPETMAAFEGDMNTEPPHVTEQPDGTWAGINWEDFAKLPEDYKAATPDEVETIIYVDWSHRKVPMEGGVTGKQLLVTVTLVDPEAKLITGTREMRGGKPQPPHLSGGRTFGSHPTGEMVDYITSVKRLYHDITGQLVDTPPT